MAAIKHIALLGSTGSIGRSALEVIGSHPERFRLVAMAAGGNVELLVAQARRFLPQAVAVYRREHLAAVAERLGDLPIQVFGGPEGVARIGDWPTSHLVLSAIVGAAGLAPTLAAVRAGKDVALANKECLVTAGSLFMAEIARHGGRLIPVDSEHSAIFQVWRGYTGQEKIILTASGGPFRGWNAKRLDHVTRQEALAHPRWSMGPKITIDSATLMNKGLEVIEAHWLFGVPAADIQVLIHPESIVHSLVVHPDGSMLAQLGMPDMRTPIAVALAWPERVASGVATLDLARLGMLTFQPAPAAADFPCLALAYQALAAGGAAPAILNAANEEAVAAFLDNKLSFRGISQVVQHTLDEISLAEPASIEEVVEVDRMARHHAGQWIRQRAS